MKSSLPKAMAIFLLSTTAACSLPWQNVPLKTEDPVQAKPAGEVPRSVEESKAAPVGQESKTRPLRQESRILPPGQERKISPPGEKPAPAPPEPAVKPEKNELGESELLLDQALESFQLSQVFWRKGDFGKAIAALDHAYQLILKVDPKGNTELGEQKETIRLMICKRAVELYATQHTGARGSEKAIPLLLNRYVQREIDLFKGSERKFFLEGYRRSGRYRPAINAALEKAGLPQELSWLPLIESGFRAEAFSRARALGLWQFIPSTGYKFGLKRDKWLDERMDAEKSTRAAIAYMKDLHNIFGDWCTVLAAYNCGEGRVLEVIRTQRVNYLDNFWDLFEKLPQETARYVPRFIATLHIINKPGEFGFTLGEPPGPIACETVKISKPVRLNDVAKLLMVSPESLEVLNSELRLKVTPPRPYDLKVPEGKGNLLVAGLNEIPASDPAEKLYAVHTVQRGETLAYLSRRYSTSIHTIAELNHLKSKDTLRIGQKLKVPTGRTMAAKAAEAEGEAPPAAEPESLRHRVKKGETLWRIVQHYRASLEETMRLNRLETTRLRIDQELLIPNGR